MKVPQKLIDRFHELQDRYYSADREAKEANERLRIAIMLRDECKIAIDAIEYCDGVTEAISLDLARMKLALQKIKDGEWIDSPHHIAKEALEELES